MFAILYGTLYNSKKTVLQSNSVLTITVIAKSRLERTIFNSLYIASHRCDGCKKRDVLREQNYALKDLFFLINLKVQSLKNSYLTMKNVKWGEVRKVPKKCHILFERPLTTFSMEYGSIKLRIIIFFFLMGLDKRPKFWLTINNSSIKEH